VAPATECMLCKHKALSLKKKIISNTFLYLFPHQFGHVTAFVQWYSSKHLCSGACLLGTFVHKVLSRSLVTIIVISLVIHVISLVIHVTRTKDLDQQPQLISSLLHDGDILEINPLAQFHCLSRYPSSKELSRSF
jgi:hypothetical protein